MQLKHSPQELAINNLEKHSIYPTNTNSLGQIRRPAGLAKDVTSTTQLVPQLKVRLADCKKDIMAAQRLRAHVFSDEFGFNCGENGIDADRFDAYCHHLLIEDVNQKKIIGTYRLLNAHGAKRCGKHYGQSEFTGALWRDMGDNLVELGRACIHPDYRSGTALMKLWQGIMDYLGVLSARYAIGYASVSLRDGGANALATQQYVDTQCRVWVGAALKPIKPLQPLQQSFAEQIRPAAGEPSALIKGYVRMGAFCIGAPAQDPVFNTADFPMLLDMTQLDKRYARHFKVDSTLTSLN